MHSFHDEVTNITIHHDGDYGGEARIMLPKWLGIGKIEKATIQGIEFYDIRLPCRVLAEFSESATVTKIVSSIESGDYSK